MSGFFLLIGRGGADQKPSKVSANVTGGSFYNVKTSDLRQRMLFAVNTTYYTYSALPGGPGPDAV